jgi:hypothetical protein
MEIKRCAACGQTFRPFPQISNQSYCSAPKCQRERRRRWQRSKLQNDHDYQDNQARAQRAWIKRNPDYWRTYREAHPKYVERNRALQRERSTGRNGNAIAKMDWSIPALPLISGIYRISQVAANGEIAKMDAWTVEITLISSTAQPTDIVKR